MKTAAAAMDDDTIFNQIFFRVGTRFPSPLYVIRVFKTIDGVDHVCLSPSHSAKDTITVSRSALMDRRFFEPKQHR